MIAVVNERMSVPFEWGKNDCCLFAADVVIAMTGQDLAADVRGLYSDKAGAIRVLKSLGFASLRQMMNARVGKEIDPFVARRGDVVLYRNTFGSALAISAGGINGLHSPAETGLGGVPLARCLCAWRVGA